MARSWAFVRCIEPGDWPVVHELWQRAVAEQPMGVDVLRQQPTAERLRATLQAPNVTVLVAEHEGTVVGLSVLTASPLVGLTDDASMTVEFLYVLPAHRGRGVAAQLLTRSAAVAESAGSGYLASVAPAAAKGANRYYARLGFNAAVTRRVVPAAALRRRLAPDAVVVTDRVLARRRSLRARTRGAGQRSVDVIGIGDAPPGRAV